jgi:hypothetical protein
MMSTRFFKVIFLLILTGVINSVNAQSIPGKKYSSLLRDGIKGAVSLSETIRYTIDTVNMIALQDSCCITRTEFDKNGNSVKMERYTLAGVYQGGTVSKYHPNGLIKQIRFLNKDKRETAREDYFIDANGNYTGGNAYDEGKLLRTFKITSQNEYGQWTKFDWYSLDGKIYREEEYKYEENRKIRDIWKEYMDDPKGKIVTDLTTGYNAKGEIITQQGFHTHLGQVNQKPNRIFEYDKQGNWIQYIIVNAAGKPVRIVKRKLVYR